MTFTEDIKKLGCHIVWLTVLFGALGFFIHVFLGAIVQSVISENMQGVVIQKPPYGIFITIVAGLTALFPAFSSLVCLSSDQEKNSRQKFSLKGCFVCSANFTPEG